MRLKYIFSSVWKIYFLLVFISTLLLFFPFFYVLLRRRQWYPQAFKLQRVWAFLLLFFAGIRYEIRQKHTPDPAQTYIICPNHFSFLDIIMLYRVFPFYFIFMAKSELLKVPLFNIFFKEMNIAVDRKSIKDSHQAMVKAGIELDRGNSVVIFPEGTIGGDSPKLRPFKNGAFKLAIEKQIPVIPVTFINNYKLLRTDPFFRASGRPGKAIIVVHKPISTAEMDEEDILALKSKVEHTIKQSLNAFGQVKARKG